jgi:hypothetical protein
MGLGASLLCRLTVVLPSWTPKVGVQLLVMTMLWHFRLHPMLVRKEMREFCQEMHAAAVEQGPLA